MALAGMDILLNLPFQLAVIIISKDSYLPWVSWEYVHHGEWDEFCLTPARHGAQSNAFPDFGRISQFPSILWKNSEGAHGLEFPRWVLVVCALVFFMFFGFAEEARKNYKSMIDTTCRRFGGSSVNTFSLGHKFGSVTSSVGYTICSILL